MKRPYKTTSRHIHDHKRSYKATNGHTRPQTAIQYHNLSQKVTLCPLGPYELQFVKNLISTFFVPFGTFFAHVSTPRTTTTTTTTTTKLLLGPLSVARGQKAISDDSNRISDRI